MNTPRTSIALIFLAAAGLTFSGCKTVDEGPTTPPNPNAQREMIGIVPKPAPIPQKNIPEGESSLRHDKPDQRIDKPNG